MPVPKMYVLVRRDLAETYRIVQGSHAVVAYSLKSLGVPDAAMKNPVMCEAYRAWNNSTIIFLGVRNEQALDLWKAKLEDAKKHYAEWYEPDLKNQMTAIACIDTGEIFKDLSLV